MGKNQIRILLVMIIFVVSCNLPFLAAETVPTLAMPSPPTATSPISTATFTDVPNVPPTDIPATSSPDITHIDFPPSSLPVGGTVYDVISEGTASEKRAPYGDKLKINRLERPFQQDMVYVPDLDIAKYKLSFDEDWIYISIELVGTNPNNELGIHYGVEIDNDGDGFGDILVWATSPYSVGWTNNNVQIFEDTNHDTAGLSSGFSDAPVDTDGYDKIIFDQGIADDPDLAWVRTVVDETAFVQFAFRHSLTDGSFMLGVIADGGLRDVSMLDYVDRFLPENAGSPVRDNQFYPLGELFLVDNTCREAFGFSPTGFEPQLCPPPEKPTPNPGDGSNDSCVPVTCEYPTYWIEELCDCGTFIFYGH